MAPLVPSLNELQEVVESQTRLANDRAQSPAIKLPMVRHHDHSLWGFAAKDDVAAALVMNRETDFRAELDAVLTREDRKPRHTATRKVSKGSAGMSSFAI